MPKLRRILTLQTCPDRTHININLLAPLQLFGCSAEHAAMTAAAVARLYATLFKQDA